MKRFANRAFGALLLMLALMVAAPVLAQGDLAFPPLSGRVVDQAGLLSASNEAALTERLAALEQATGDQLVVVTVDDLGGREIEDYGYRLGRAWGIGQAEINRGALLIVAPNQRQVRIEVGYGLEPVLTDALSALIISEQILPAFRANDFQRGINQGADALIAQLSLDPEEAEARAAAARPKAAFDPGLLLPVLIWLFVLGIIAFQTARGSRRYRRQGKGALASVILWAAEESRRGNRSGGGGGRSNGGGFGGGGFSGGGGSFGGGGASGRW